MRLAVRDKISPRFLNEQPLRRGSLAVIRRTLSAVVGAGRAAALDLRTPDKEA